MIGVQMAITLGQDWIEPDKCMSLFIKGYVVENGMERKKVMPHFHCELLQK